MQVPAQVDYEKAASVEQALGLLARYGPAARILAGGHSLIPMMKLRLAHPEVLIDINPIASLRYIEMTATVLKIGALARHADLLASREAGECCAILHDAERVIADPIVRNWGTVGGSLCQADPSEDLSAAFAALKGSMIICGPDGEREVSAREFHTGPYETVIGPAEMLTEIRIPVKPGSGSAYVKVSRRAGDWPVGAAGAAVRLSRGGEIEDAGIGLTALGATHFA
ncbi:MAG: FAD binding domain-containing protein, partial [Trebonia sp.]